ncbi:MAG: hypothetical protein J1G06_09180 [Oscillospiraceae bacterium]|nr:hypothetical protein [Oscillospiraceae bacterium]
MNFKRFISGVSAIAIAASAFAAMTITASAAGYTLSLSDSLEVAGYKAEQLYNFTNNTPDVLPAATGQNLSYREGWGLHNYASGGRSATASIPVTEGDIIVLQVYQTQGGTPDVSIDCGTKNDNLTASASPYYVYDITKDAENITFTTARYNGIVGALVMEKDAEATTADYTFNYYCGDTLVKSDKGTSAVGATVNAIVPFTYEGVKYIALDDAVTSMTVKANAADNVVTVNVRKADNFNVTLKNNLNDAAVTAEVVEGEDATLYYNRYALVGTTLYEAPALTKEGNGNAYEYKFSAVTEDADYTVEYAVKDDSEYVFYAEGEDIFTEAATGNVPIRCSGGKGGYTEAETVITKLPAGTYKMVIATFGNAGTVFTATIGDNTVESETKGYLNEGVSEEFTVTEDTDVVIGAMGNGGSSPKVIDYIYIIKTGDVEPETQDITIDKVATYTGDSEVANDELKTDDVLTLFKSTIESISGTITGVTIDNQAVESFEVDNSTVLTDAAAVVAIIVNAAANTASITVTLD